MNNNILIQDKGGIFPSLFLTKTLEKMKKIIVLLVIILIGILGFWAFHLGIILLKALIGVGVLALIGIGVVIGRMSKS